jgi:carbon starvation protein CstA
MRALLWGALVGLLWVLFPTVLAAAVAVALAVLVKAAPAALLLAVLARTVPARVRRWAR